MQNTKNDRQTYPLKSKLVVKILYFFLSSVTVDFRQAFNLVWLIVCSYLIETLKPISELVSCFYQQ